MLLTLPRAAALLLVGACTGSGPPATETGHHADRSLDLALATPPVETGDTGETGEPTDSDETADSSILDADGDGHLAESDGGDDCDDTNPRVYPGAEDWCTAIDENCDGVAIDDGRCSDTQAFLSRASKLSEHAYLYMVPMRDLTGDGLDDILVSDGSGDVGLSAGDGTWGAFTDWPLVATWLVPDGCGRDPSHLDIGDLDGDGYNDVVLGGCTGGYDIAWGPFDGSDPEPPTTTWANPGTYGGGEQRWTDADGDGHPDLLYWSVDEPANLDLLVLSYGGQRGADMTVISSERSGESGRDRLGDVDGDGCDDFEVAYGSDDSPTWFSGCGIPRGADTTREDVMTGTVVHVDGVDIRGATFPQWLAVGDWSGDGLDDAIFVDQLSRRGSLLYYDDFTSSSDVAASGQVVNDDVIEDNIGAYPGIVREWLSA